MSNSRPNIHYIYLTNYKRSHYCAINNFKKYRHHQNLMIRDADYKYILQVATNAVIFNIIEQSHMTNL